MQLSSKISWISAINTVPPTIPQAHIARASRRRCGAAAVHEQGHHRVKLRDQVVVHLLRWQKLVRDDDGLNTRTGNPDTDTDTDRDETEIKHNTNQTMWR